MSLQVSDSQAARFERGFKTWAENTSGSVRGRLGLTSTDPLPPAVLANDLGVQIWTPSDVPALPQESLEYLVSPEGNEWSAVSVYVGPVGVIVVNPTHSTARQASDLMHELSHLIRGHQPSQIHHLLDGSQVSLRTFNPLQEAEADWLAGCLLLPRDALKYCMARKLSASQACGLYGVSTDLYRYRVNITGVNRQFASAKRHKASV
jgi:hypothetical protein